MASSGSYPPDVVSATAQITDTQLVVEWEFASPPTPPYQTPVEIAVDGEVVYSRSGNLFARGPYTEEVNLVELPAGQSMPVELRLQDATINAGRVTVVDGGGGVRLPPGDDPPASAPDRLQENLVDVSSPEAGVVVVEWRIENPLTRGSGNRVIGGGVEITVDGEVVERVSLSLPPADQRRGEVRVTGVAPGEHEVCVRPV